MADTPIQRLKQLDQERTQLLASAKKEALERANTAIHDLNALGFNYRLSEDGRAASRGSGRKRRLKEAPCPVCKFKTSPPHDARKHRGQGKRKKPFTAVELNEMGLERA
jgi:hypothetical protein